MVLTYPILYFLIGVVYDIALTVYTLAMTDRRPYLTGSLSMILTWTSITVLSEIIPDGNAHLEIQAYSLGCGVGAMLGVKYHAHWSELYKDVMRLFGLKRTRKVTRPKLPR